MINLNFRAENLGLPQCVDLHAHISINEYTDNLFFSYTSHFQLKALQIRASKFFFVTRMKMIFRSKNAIKNR